MSEIKRKKILLEIGTNELEIMEFLIDGRSFGINVAKILEIMKYEEITPIPHSNIYIEGIFKPRDQIITVINMAKYLSLNPSKYQERDILIITNFNKCNTAFHVHSVETIHRISWKNIEKPDNTIYTSLEGLTTGIARVENKLITILDFEKIMAEINPNSSIKISSIDDKSEKISSDKLIYVVEDSVFLSELILECLNKAGYKNIKTFYNGQEAWNELEKLKKENNDILENLICIITDIEMPIMDGHTLTKFIKNDDKLKFLPVAIFSSLINDAMRVKGESLGVDIQISKPEILCLVDFIDNIVNKKEG